MKFKQNSYLNRREGELLKSVKDDAKCQTCLFYGLCTKVQLPHCLGSDYVKDSLPKEKKS